MKPPILAPRSPSAPDPPTLGQRLGHGVGALLRLQPGEAGLVAHLFGLTLLLALAGALASSGLDAILLSRFGAGPLPLLYVLVGAIGIGLSFAVSSILSRGRRGHFYIRLCALLAVALLAVRWLVGIGGPVPVPLAWLAISAIGTLQGLVGWGLAGLLCDTRQAGRLFPLFGSGSVLGAVIGGLLTPSLAAAAGAESLVVLAAAATGLAYVVGLRLRSRVQAEPPRRPTPALADARRGLDTALATPMLRWLLAASVLFSVLYFALAYPFARSAAVEYPDSARLAGFLGTFQAAATGAAFLVSTLLSSSWGTGCRIPCGVSGRS